LALSKAPQKISLNAQQAPPINLLTMAYIDQYRTSLSIFVNASICKIIRPVIRMKLVLILHMAAANSEESGKYRYVIGQHSRKLLHW